MEFENYTDRARGFVQSAQTYALGQGHQQFAPEHLLKVLLDDPEGLAAGLIARDGGQPKEALAAVETALGKLPKVSGGTGWKGRPYSKTGVTEALFERFMEKLEPKIGGPGLPVSQP